MIGDIIYEDLSTRTRKDELEKAAQKFHLSNPNFWVLFIKFTQEMANKGFSNYSTNAIFERIRWETDTVGEDGLSTFKVNNNHRPYYARWYMEKFPEHKGFFRTRELFSKNEIARGLPELTPRDFRYDNC
jgi:hypothetical protein